MSIEPTPEPVAGQEPGRARSALVGALRFVGLLLLIAAISAASAYGVFEWRIQQEQQSTSAQVEAARDQFQRQATDLEERITKQQAEIQAQLQQAREQTARVEQAAESARILMAQNGDLTVLDAKLKEIDTLKLDLQKSREEFESKLQAVEKSIIDQAAKQGRETAQALAVELAWKSLLIKAQGEVLLAQIHWADGNRGLSRDEIGIASATLRQALERAPESVNPGIKQVFDLAEQAKTAMILEQSSARDNLNLLWHKVSELLVPPAGN